MAQEVITDDYRKLNQKLHSGRPDYGARERHEVYEEIVQLIGKHDCMKILDYGCGKATMSKFVDNVTNYDPCVEAFDVPVDEHDMVVCTDVLEHIEPELLDNVLADIRRNARKVIYLIVATRPDSSKTLPDGRNPHLIVQPGSWWLKRIREMMPSWKIHAEINPAKGEAKFICTNGLSF